MKKCTRTIYTDIDEKISVFEKTLGNVLDRLCDVEYGLLNTKRAIDNVIDKMRVEESCVGFRGDEVFIPSVEEYEKYKDKIPSINCYWWLRSPGCSSGYAVTVCYDDYVGRLGNYVGVDGIGVRPMIHLPSGTIEINAPIGARINLHNFPWIVIDKYLAIAEVPIGFEKFDETSNNYYKESHIRKFLLDWLNERK